MSAASVNADALGKKFRDIRLSSWLCNQHLIVESKKVAGDSMFRKSNPLKLKVEIRPLDSPNPRQYAARMDADQIYTNLLQLVANSLAISFGDAAERLSVDKDELKQQLATMQKTGLIRVQTRKQGELSDESILSITGDGSKALDSLHKRSFEVAIAQRV